MNAAHAAAAKRDIRLFCCGQLASGAAASLAVTPAEITQLGALLDANRLSELESKSLALLERHPNSGLVWQVLGVCRRRQGKEAVSAMHRAVSLLPGDAVAHNNLGNALGSRGRLNEAVTSYRQAISLSQADFAEAFTTI